MGDAQAVIEGLRGAKCPAGTAIRLIADVARHVGALWPLHAHIKGGGEGRRILGGASVRTQAGLGGGHLGHVALHTQELLGLGLHVRTGSVRSLPWRG